jgi:hypothetical protein
MMSSSAPLREVTPASAFILFKRKRDIFRRSILDSLGVFKAALMGACAYFTPGLEVKQKEAD